MNDTQITPDETILQKLGETGRAGSGRSQGTVPENKDEVVGMLRSLGAASLLVEYDAWEDPLIEPITCRGPDDAVIELPPHAREAVEDFVYESLPDGWEFDGCFFGSVEFDIAAGTVRFRHAKRVVEVFKSEWEG